MLHHDSDSYWLSRQQDMLPANRFDGLVNSISVSDRSETRRLIAHTLLTVARVGHFVGAAVVGSGKVIAKTFSVRLAGTP